MLLVNSYSSMVLKYSNFKYVLTVLALNWIVYGYIIVVTIPTLMVFSNGLKPLDMRPMGYSHEYALNLFSKLGEEGRNYYLTRQIPIDMIYPALFACAYSILTVFLGKKAGLKQNTALLLSVVPIFAGLFDYLENIGIILMINSFPVISIALSSATNIFSVVKSIFTSIFFMVAIVLLMKIVIGYFRNRLHRP